MLRLVNLEEIQSMLLRVPDLTDLQENREMGFIEGVKGWLKALEEILRNNQMPHAGKVASLRGGIISAQNGVIPSGITFHGRATARKIKNAAASDALLQAVELVSKAIQQDGERVSEAKRICRELVALAKGKGLAFSHLMITKEFRAIWRTLAADPDVGPGTINIERLVGPNDALILLDRTLSSDASSIMI